MEYIRRELANRIHQIRATRNANKLDNYFANTVTGNLLPEIEAVDIPDIATDVRSTYLRLHQKKHTYAEDKNFHIVKNALSQLRGYVNEKQLHKITTDPPKRPKTIRQYFKEKNIATLCFDLAKSSTEASGAQEGKAPMARICGTACG